jgi:hypothetical protein
MKLHRAILPPLLILPLAFFPFDMATSAFWFAAIVCAMASLVRLVKALVRKQRGLGAPERERVLRQSLTIACTLGAVAAVTWSQSAADDHGRAIAAQVQAECRQAGKCPQTVAAWGHSDRTRYGGTAQHDLRYRGGGDTFQLIVIHNIDQYLSITGGVRAELTEYLYDEEQEAIRATAER